LEWHTGKGIPKLIWEEAITPESIKYDLISIKQSFIIIILFIYLLVMLWFELKILYLLGRHSTTEASPLVQYCQPYI
jgi:hypothetical protein